MARKHVEEWLLKFLEDLTNTKDNSEFYKNHVFPKFKNDKQFSNWVDELVAGTKKLTITVPNNTDIEISIERCKKLAKQMGHEFFQHLYIGSDDPDIPPYKTNEKYMVIDQSVMRLAQFSDTALKHSEDNDSVDNATKQPIGGSEGASITHSELQILGGLGLKATLNELFKVRGGDAGSLRAMHASMAAKGSVSLNEIDQYSTGVGSSKLTDAYLKGMHIRATI